MTSRFAERKKQKITISDKPIGRFRGIVGVKSGSLEPAVVTSLSLSSSSSIPPSPRMVTMNPMEEFTHEKMALSTRSRIKWGRITICTQSLNRFDLPRLDVIRALGKAIQSCKNFDSLSNNRRTIDHD
jgi:hypothetical protein